MAGVIVVSKLASDAAAVRLAVSTSPKLTDLVYSVPAATDDKVVRNQITGLSADTEYWYALEIDGALRIGHVGRFRTKPASGPASFRFGFASCQRTGSNHEIFDMIQESNLLFFMQIGDLHYENIAVNDGALFEAEYDRVLASPRQGRMYRNLPVHYIWDDHDYGPNDSDGTSPSKEASQLTWRRRVPHPPIEYPTGANPIYHSFEVGRVVFAVLDLRSERSPNADADNASKSMMGAAQKAWLKSLLTSPANAGKFFIIVSSSVWVSGPDNDADTWNRFSIERSEMAQFFADNGLTDRMCIICGDRHSIAIDDGTNSGYGAGGVGGLPSFRAAPIDQSNTQTGTYSEGTFADNQNQFGIVEITDTGGASIDVTFRGMAYGEGEIVSYSFTSGAL